MRDASTFRPHALLLVVLLAATGCQTTRDYALSAIGLQEKPLAMALVTEADSEGTLGGLNPFVRYAAYQQALSEGLERPVAIDPCLAFQAQSGLASGWYSLAEVSPTDFAQLARKADLRVLAIPVDTQGRAARPAVLVVSARSEIQDVADLRGKRVAFGPAGDARTHHAAQQLLQEAGLKKTDLSLEVLPVPGSLKHMPNMAAVAKSVANQSSDAGFLDEAAWERLPPRPRKEGDASRQDLRVIARTMALPDRLLIASPKLDDEMLERARTEVLAMHQDHPEALEPLGTSAYEVPAPEIVERCAALNVPEKRPPALEPEDQ
jgi:ABC-type phosphate/phosphonate transport system substrate-binding protein